MHRARANGYQLLAILYFLTFIPILVSLLRLYELPAGALPEDGLRFAETPWRMWLHALGGSIFGLLGPLQFWGAFRRRFGRLHRLSGRIFVASGLLMSASGLALLARFHAGSGDLTDLSRLVFGLLLGIVLVHAVSLAIAGRFTAHRDWMIRAYAIGMGTSPLAFIYMPLFLLGLPTPGPLADDLIFVGLWCASVGTAELVIAWLHRPAHTPVQNRKEMAT